MNVIQVQKSGNVSGKPIFWAGLDTDIRPQEKNAKGRAMIGVKQPPLKDVQKAAGFSESPGG